MRFLFTLALASSLLAQAPKRIVSTAPSITETLFAIGLGSRVVGVSTYCHFPAETNKLPRVGTYMQPNVEVIARLQPDLVIVQTLPNSVRSQLDALHIPTAEVDTGSLSQNLEAMIAIGKAAGAEASARQLVGRIRQKLTDLRAGSHKGTTPSAAFIVGRTPGKLDGLVAVGGGSYLSELIERAGGRNVFADAAQPYIKVSMETILRRDPTVLIDMGDMAETVGITQATKDNVVRLWSSQGRLSAVRQHRVYAVAADIFVVPGPRMLDAAQAFATMLHPETTR